MSVLSCAAEIPMQHSINGEHEPAAVFITTNNALDEDTEEHIFYANLGNIAPGTYEVPVAKNRDPSQYEAVVEHRTVGPMTECPNVLFPLHEGVGCGTGSATSSLFYQYVPSKVRTPILHGSVYYADAIFCT